MAQFCKAAGKFIVLTNTSERSIRVIFEGGIRTDDVIAPGEEWQSFLPMEHNVQVELTDGQITIKELKE